MKLDSYWLDTAPPLLSASEGPVDGHTDVAVIGGGFTGLSAAQALASRGASVTVLDSLPVSQDARIEVEQLSGTTRPTTTDWEAYKGVLAWTYELKPGEERVIDFGYALTYPEGTAVAGM